MVYVAVDVLAYVVLGSLLVAIYFIPYLGNLLLKERPAQEAPHQGSRMTVLFRKQLVWALRRRRWGVAGTVALFVLSLAAFTLVEQQFFPASARSALLVTIR